MTRLDADGLPSVIQRLRYSWYLLLWEADLFDGGMIRVSSESLVPGFQVLGREIPDTLWWAVCQDITALVLEFPERFLIDGRKPGAQKSVA